MARTKIKRKGVDWKELLGEEKDLLKSVVQEVVQEILEGEMEQVVAAAKSERTARSFQSVCKKRRRCTLSVNSKP